MENQQNSNAPYRMRNNSGRVMAGIIVVMVGLGFLTHQAGFTELRWLFRWPMIVLVVGLFIGARHNFRFGGWMIVTLVGTVFLLDDALDFFQFDIARYFWPVIIIAIGLSMIFRPRRRDITWDSTVSSEDVIDSTAVFGGSKTSVISKNFKGGEISTFFGGTDLNLMQADFQGTVTINTSTAFGGVKLLAPAHWNIKSEVVCIFGGIDDKRPIAKEGTDMNKTLVLRGTCMFGGFDIKSY